MAHKRQTPQLPVESSRQFASEQDEELHSLTQRASGLALQGEYSMATRMFQSVVARNEKRRDAWYGLGYCYYKMGDYQQSALILRRAALLGNPSAPVLLRKIARRAPRDVALAELAFQQDFSFDGSAFDLWLRAWTVLLVSLATAGLAAPTMTVWFLRWKARCTIYAGRRLHFTGKAADLFPRALATTLLVVCTAGLGLLAVPYLFQRWKFHHTLYEGKPAEFMGDFAEWFGVHMVYLRMIPILSLGLLLPWGLKHYIIWECRNLQIRGRQLQFNGKATDLLGWSALNLLFVPLHILSFGYTACLAYVILTEWRVENLRFVPHARPEKQSVRQEQAADVSPANGRKQTSNSASAKGKRAEKCEEEESSPLITPDLLSKIDSETDSDAAGTKHESPLIPPKGSTRAELQSEENDSAPRHHTERA
jgi:uncharacterized membrane protein YjgN (DUF898 family)